MLPPLPPPARLDTSKALTVAGDGVALLDLLSILSDQHGLLREGERC